MISKCEQIHLLGVILLECEIQLFKNGGVTPLVTCVCFSLFINKDSAAFK